MNKSTSIISGVVIVTLILLFTLGNKQSSRGEVIVSETGTEIPCLPNGHQKVASHIHPVLTIATDEEQEIIPGNVGIDGTCMREIHTHDASGIIHVETAKSGVTYTLADFLSVLGQDTERQGYTLEIKQDGGVKESVKDVILTDQSAIEMNYVAVVE